MLLGKDEDTLKAVVSSMDNIYTSKDFKSYHLQYLSKNINRYYSFKIRAGNWTFLIMEVEKYIEFQ